MTPTEQRKTQQALMFLGEKCDGTIKGRMVHHQFFNFLSRTPRQIFVIIEAGPKTNFKLENSKLHFQIFLSRTTLRGRQWNQPGSRFVCLSDVITKASGRAPAG
jgi:hypothetical protein